VLNRKCQLEENEFLKTTAEGGLLRIKSRLNSLLMQGKLDLPKTDRIPTARGANLSESEILKNNTLDAPTKNALVAFQKRYSLPQHGKLDRATLLKLVPELKDTKRYTVKE
jgi:hypothetical protein